MLFRSRGIAIPVPDGMAEAAGLTIDIDTLDSTIALDHLDPAILHDSALAGQARSGKAVGADLGGLEFIHYQSKGYAGMILAELVSPSPAVATNAAPNPSPSVTNEMDGYDRFQCLEAVLYRLQSASGYAARREMVPLAASTIAIMQLGEGRWRGLRQG